MPIGILDIACIVLVLSGLLFFFGASIGLLRFPDFYTRMHAAGKGDTLSTLLIMAGVCCYELNKLDLENGVVISILLVVVKILGIGIFIMLTSPTSTHALMKAGYEDHIEPVGERDEMEIEMPPLGGRSPTAKVEEESQPAPAAKKKATKKAAAKKKSATKKKATRRKKD